MAIYTVKPGDSLYSIGRAFRTTAARIATDNGISNPSAISVGQSLYITEPTETYTAVAGDTLFSIAQRYGVSVGQLYRNNPGLMGDASLSPGEVIFISLPAPEYPREAEVTGYAYPFIDRDTLRTALPYLTYLSVFTYGINDDLTLIPPSSDDELIALAREYQVTPIMMVASLNSEGFFSNDLANSILSNEQKRAALAENIAATAEEKGYGGVEFDFEYISGEYAEEYADLLRRTKALISPKLVFVDLAPKESDDKPGLLYEGHDYRALGEIADRLLLMTYEYGYTYGPPLAVAPINQVRRVIEYATSVIPPEKLLLGEPNYGYNWTLPYVAGTSKAKSLSNIEAVELAAEKRAEIEYDEVAQAPHFSYYDKTANGAVRHEVWFGDARSVDASWRQIDEFGLGGTGIWNIMRRFPQMYLVLNSLYNIKKS